VKDFHVWFWIKAAFPANSAQMINDHLLLQLANFQAYTYDNFSPNVVGLMV
jgi:hypothetical protein